MAQITIEKGNTLGGIATKQSTTVEELLRLNPNITDPNLIIAGEQLNVPEVFQGAVPQGASEDIFRATGVTEPITSAVLVPTADIPVVSPAPVVPPALTPTPTPTPTITPTEPTPTAPTPPTLTPEQQEIQRRTEELIELNKEFLGRAAFRREKEEEFGVPEIEATQRDLTAQLSSLIEVAKGIPLGLTTVGAKEMGISTRGITTLQRDDLRENAIKSLMVSALLQATQGNLATAQDQVDRAIGDKYNPIEEEINVKLANLDLILASPRFTQSEKDQAQKQKDIQEKKKSEIQEQKVEQKAIWDISVDAAQANASPTVLRNIQDAQTKEEALRIATEAGLFEKEKKAPSRTEIKQVDTIEMANVLSSVADENGYVSPENYNKAKRAWVNEGYSSASFDTQFSIYKDPSLDY